MTKPENYRSICIQNPFLKVFTKIIHTRLMTYLEDQNLLPNTQFGFRSRVSTISACFTLKDIIRNRLKAKKKTFCVFVDFKKAFPSVNRKKLFTKMIMAGIPIDIIEILNQIYNETDVFIKNAKGFMKEGIKTRIGLPEGCCLSPILFSLFLSDFDNAISETGIGILDQEGGNIKIKYLAFADDIVIICEDEHTLRQSMLCLETYCNINGLTMHVDKTKVMIFAMGRPNKFENFTLYGEVVERVNQFKYLGMVFAVQLRFTEHVTTQIHKAKTKIGFLFRKLNLTFLSLELALKIFKIYIEPIITYGITVWWGLISNNCLQMVNALFTKYLKSWIGIPAGSNNAFLYFFTNTTPLTENIKEIVFPKLWDKVLMQLPHLENVSFVKMDVQIDT